MEAYKMEELREYNPQSVPEVEHVGQQGSTEYETQYGRVDPSERREGPRAAPPTAIQSWGRGVQRCKGANLIT